MNNDFNYRTSQFHFSSVLSCSSEQKVEGIRPRGWPRQRLRDSVEENLRDLGVNIWRESAGKID